MAKADRSTAVRRSCRFYGFVVSLLLGAGAATALVQQSAQSWSERKLVAADGAVGDNFGYALAVSGTNVLIGAYVRTVDGREAQGVVYAFTQAQDGAWTQTQVLVADDGDAFGQFGESIAIDGSTALIGANGSRIGAQRFQGAVYVFEQHDGHWQQTAKLVAADGAGYDNFGWSVALHGTRALIGAPYADVAGHTDQGAAYVFDYDGTAWTQTRKLSAADGAADDGFGRAVALSAGSALVGAAQAGIGAQAMQGAVYAYRTTADGWSQAQKLVAADGAATDNFGQAIALSGNDAFIGAPLARAVYVFADDGTTWSQAQKLVADDDGTASSGYFGYALAAHGNGAVVGAFDATIGENTFQGAAYVFGRSAGHWSQTAKLSASDGAAYDNLGIGVGMSATSVVAGAYYAAVDGRAAQGAAYVYRNPDMDRVFCDGFDASACAVTRH